MAETVVIRVTVTDTEGATDTAESTITVDAPAAPDEFGPTITSLTADDSTLDPGQSTNITVTGINYDSVLWDSSIALVEHADGVEKQVFTAPLNVVVGTEYIVSVTLSKSHRTATRSIPLTINNVAPIITSLDGIPIAPNFVTVGGNFTATATASDNNGDDIVYSWESEGVSQDAGMADNERDFTAPDSITGVSDAQKTIICTASDVPPSPHASMSNSRQQGFIVAGDKPGPPIIDGVTATHSTIEISWFPPTDNGGAPITGYRVWLRIDDSSNFTRSVVLGPTIRSHTYENLALDTPHEVAVEAFNTFTIGANNYGQTSDRATQNTRTEAEIVIVAPDPADPNDHAPTLTALTEISIIYRVNQIESLQSPITHLMSVDYFDEDGDMVAISWGTTPSELAGSLSADPQPDPFAGITDAQLTIPAGNVGSQSVSCVGVDGRDPRKFGIVIFSIRAVPLT